MTLGDLISIKHGWPFKSELYSLERLGRPVVVSIGNFEYTGGFRFGSTVTKEYSGDYPKAYELEPGSILLVMTCQTAGGEILGIPARVPNDGRIYLHNQRIGLVQLCSGQVEPGFLYWVFLSRDFNQHLVATASGTKILHTAPSRIESFRFRLPPLPEQRVIAHVLGTLDDKIELNRKMSETLEELARTLFKSWFVDFDPVHAKAAGKKPFGTDDATAALFPDSFEDSELGPIPSGWRVGTLGETLELTMGQSPPGSTYNESGNGIPFYQGARDFGWRFVSPRVFCTAPTRLAAAGSVLVSVRAPVGRLNVTQTDCAIGRGVAAVRHPSGAHQAFVLETLRSCSSSFERFNGEGTVFGSISKGDFERIRVVTPPDKVISAFSAVADALSQRIELAHDESRTLAELRDTLLPRLLSGELRVPLDVVEAADTGRGQLGLFESV